MLLQSVPDISPQSAAIYRLLLASDALTAGAIGKKLNIYPHAVYRAVKPLLHLGLIDGTDEYPVRYKKKPTEDAVNRYLMTSREGFLQSFFPQGLDGTTTQAATNGLPTTFVQNRQDLLEQSKADMNSAKSDVVMIVSGLEGPADTILAYKRAAERDVRIRIIVQRLDETNEEMLKNWKKLGIEVRYYPLIEARILIFDNNIVYFTSYNPTVKEEGIGVRFAYPPMALLMNELFEKRWELAEEIN